MSNQLLILFLIFSSFCFSQKNDDLKNKDVLYSPVYLCFDYSVEGIINWSYPNGQPYCQYLPDTTFSRPIYLIKYYRNGSIATKTSTNRKKVKRYYTEEEKRQSLGFSQLKGEVLDYTVDLYCLIIWETYYKNGKQRSYARLGFDGVQNTSVFNKRGILIYHAESSEQLKKGLLFPRMENYKIRCEYYLNSVLLYNVYFSINSNELISIRDLNDNEVNSRKLKNAMSFYYEFMF